MIRLLVGRSLRNWTFSSDAHNRLVTNVNSTTGNSHQLDNNDSFTCQSNILQLHRYTLLTSSCTGTTSVLSNPRPAGRMRPARGFHVAPIVPHKLTDYWMKYVDPNNFPELYRRGKKLLTMFGSTYVYEAGFSAMTLSLIHISEPTRPY